MYYSQVLIVVRHSSILYFLIRSRKYTSRKLDPTAQTLLFEIAPLIDLRFFSSKICSIFRSSSREISTPSDAILEDEDTVKNLIPDIAKIAKMPSRGLIVSAKGKEVDFVSRVFGPNVGVDEDPVTGSAHALLATYWASILGKNDLTARQLSKREGSLHCSVKEDTVEITGHAVLYLRGTIEV